MGTATYFSPEQAQGLPLDPRSDLYSLGVVLYEMLTGQPPFQGDSPVAIAYKHVQEPPRPPRSINLDVPPELEAITLQLLAKRPEPTATPSADDLRADLRRYREGFRVHAADRARRRRRGRPPPLSRASAAVVPARGHRGRPFLPRRRRRSRRTRRRPSGARGRSSSPSSCCSAVLVGLLLLLAQTLGVGEDDGTPTSRRSPCPTSSTWRRPTPAPQLEAQGFVVEPRIAEEVADAAQVGIVVDQDPDGGDPRRRRVHRGDHASGPRTRCAMPNLAGSTPDQARNTLQGLGFTGRAQPAGGGERRGRTRPSHPHRPGHRANPSPSTPPSRCSSPAAPQQSLLPACDNLTESDCVTAASTAPGSTRHRPARPSPTVTRAGSSAPSRPRHRGRDGDGSISVRPASYGPGRASRSRASHDDAVAVTPAPAVRPTRGPGGDRPDPWATRPPADGDDRRRPAER